VTSKHLLDNEDGKVTDDAIASALVSENENTFEVFHQNERLRKHFLESGKLGLFH
jgi:hypothetical protein